MDNLVKEMTDKRSSIIHKTLPADDPKQRRPDITLAQTMLDWKPLVPLAEGLKATIGYFEKRLSEDKASLAHGD